MYAFQRPFTLPLSIENLAYVDQRPFRLAYAFQRCFRPERMHFSIVPVSAYAFQPPPAYADQRCARTAISYTTKMSDNEPSDNSLTSELVGNSFFKPIIIKEIVTFYDYTCNTLPVLYTCINHSLQFLLNT